MWEHFDLIVHSTTLYLLAESAILVSSLMVLQVVCTSNWPLDFFLAEEQYHC